MGILNLKALAIASLRFGSQPGATARRGDISRSLGREWRKGGIIFYRLRVNSALAQLGLQARVFSPSYRRFMLSTGHLFGNSPQEVALFMAAQRCRSHSACIPRAVVNGWIRKGQIDLTAEPVRTAMAALNRRGARQ